LIQNGSRFVQQAIEVATTKEIVMVYREIMPCIVFVCSLLLSMETTRFKRFLSMDRNPTRGSSSVI
ncbi:hypothetical protein BAE44_0022061, partial [Dichanthelium oligosanthes]